MTSDHVILGIHVSDRLHQAGELQQVLTEYGAHIKTRLGLPELGRGAGSHMGLVLLEVVGEGAALARMKAQLSAIPGLELKEMVFSHK